MPQDHPSISDQHAELERIHRDLVRVHRSMTATLRLLRDGPPRHRSPRPAPRVHDR